MPEPGGWLVTVADEGENRLLMVANPDKDEAEKLALAYAGSGTVVGGEQVWAEEIARFDMRPNEIKESRQVGHTSR